MSQNEDGHYRTQKKTDKDQLYSVKLVEITKHTQHSPVPHKCSSIYRNKRTLWCYVFSRD